MSRVSNDIYRPGAGVVELVRDNGLTEHDAREVFAFSRFLREVGGADRGALARAPGWIPYALGFGPWPDVGCAQLPVTAWNLCP